MQKLFSVISLLFVSTFCFSQRFFYSDAKILTYKSKYEIIGKIKDHILVWIKNIKDDRSELLCFDNEMRLIKKVKVEEVRNAASIQFFNNENSFYVALKQLTKDVVAFKLFLFDENGLLQSEITLDSAHRDSTKTFGFTFIQSPDKKTICLIQAEADPVRETLKLNCSFVNDNSVTQKSFGLPYSLQDYIADFSIDAHQNIYLLKAKNDTAKCTIDLFKACYSEETMRLAEKQLQHLSVQNIKLFTNNDTCFVYGILKNAGSNNVAYIWQTDYELNDLPGSSLVTGMHNIIFLQNVTSYNSPTRFFYAVYDSAFKINFDTKNYTPDIWQTQRDIEKRDYHSFSQSMIPDFDDKPNFNNKLNNHSPERRSSFSATPVQLNIFRLFPDSHIKIENAVYSNDTFGNTNLIAAAKVIRKYNKTHVIYPVIAGKNKTRVKYLFFSDDGKETEAPALAWKSGYNYLLHKALEIEDGLIIPCLKGEKLFFAKMEL